jgi:hypothetical protein
MTAPSKKTMDARLREKLKARAEGRTPVLVTENVGGDPLSREALNVKFRAKLKARAEAAKSAGNTAKPVESTDESKGKKSAGTTAKGS